MRDLRVARTPVTPDDLIALEMDVLAAVFGFDPRIAIRYAEKAGQLLQTTAEEQDPASSRELKGPNHP